MLTHLDSLLTESERNNMFRNNKISSNTVNMFKLDIVKIYAKKDMLKDIIKCPKLQKKHKLLSFNPIECN